VSAGGWRVDGSSAGEEPAVAAMQLPLRVLVGHPRPASRTLAVSRLAAATLRADLCRNGLGVDSPVLVDLAALLPHLAAGLSGSGPIAQALAEVREARLLIVTSPTFKASFSGLLKFFLDLLPPRGLTGVIAVPLMTAADRRHAHAVRTHLRPLLQELGATVPAAGLCILEDRLAEPQPVLDAWSAVTASVLARALPCDRKTGISVL
jgi:FMN reductase